MVRDELQGPRLSKSTFRDKVWKRLDAKVKATRGRVEPEQRAKEDGSCWLPGWWGWLTQPGLRQGR